MSANAPPPGDSGGARASIFRKVLVTAATGGITYGLTAFADPIQSLTLSCFIGGVALLIQFLVEFDGRLSSLENRVVDHEISMRDLVREGFSNVNEATKLYGLVEDSQVRPDIITRLVSNAAKVGDDRGLIYDFVQREITQMGLMLQQLNGGVEVSCEGEDRAWLLGLTATAQTSIDATSYSTVDAGDKSFDDGFWSSDLGQRYLQAQRDAVRRGITIRRVFIFDRVELANEAEFLAICQVQTDIGIEVRILLHNEIRHPTLVLRDFILFDERVSYETVASPSRVLGESRPSILNTYLVLDGERIRGRLSDFEELWGAAHPYDREGVL